MGFWEELYDAMSSLQSEEANQDYALQKMSQAIGAPFEDMWTLVVDSDDGKPGWSILLDITRCPDEYLPWLAQFVGAKPILGESSANYRLRIASAWVWHRGTLDGIYQAAARVGCTRFLVNERVGGDAWAVQFLFLSSEYTQAKEDYIARWLPAGIIWSHAFWSGVIYQGVKTTYATYQAAKTANANYQALRGG